MTTRFMIVWVILAMLIVSAVPNRAAQNRPAAAAATTPAPQGFNTQVQRIRVVTIGTGLFHPWSLAFVDAQTLLVAEKNGKLRLIRAGVLSPEAVWTSPSSTPAWMSSSADRCVRVGHRWFRGPYFEEL